MSLNKALANLKFDKRLLELNVKMGRVTQEEMDKHAESQPDQEAMSEKLDIEKEDKNLI
jgi:predicted secreted Zn-dependent protease